MQSIKICCKTVAAGFDSPKKREPKARKSLALISLREWAEADLNRRHTDFQSVALPTELPARTA